MLEIKMQNKEISLDWAEMLLKVSSEFKPFIRECSQVVFKSESVLVKGRNGRYIGNLSLAKMQDELNKVL